MKDELEKIKNYNYNGVKEHQKMTMPQRAAHFSAFSAVVGFKDLVEEKKKTADKI